jgi:Pterin-4a-carbinolamine dehydratase
MVKLNEEDIARRLRELSGWKYENGFLVKNFKFRRFMQGIKFVNSVADLAEKIEHHPDIHIRWTNVRLEIQSHDEGGVTDRDFKLVKRIEEMLKKEERKHEIQKHL